MTSKNKSLEISGKKATFGNLSVSPAIVEFKSIEAGKSYESTLVLQNLHKEPRNIKVKLAGDAPLGVFSIPNQIQNSDIYAPYGLDKKILVKFTPPESREYAERIIVTSDVTLEIPIRG